MGVGCPGLLSSVLGISSSYVFTIIYSCTVPLPRPNPFLLFHTFPRDFLWQSWIITTNYWGPHVAEGNPKPPHSLYELMQSLFSYSLHTYTHTPSTTAS